MKYILDASAILDEPEILAVSKTRNLVIPQSVIDELIFKDISNSRMNISGLIDQAIELGAIITDDTRSSTINLDYEAPDVPRLSSSEIEVLKLAVSEAKKLENDTFITVVTMNRALGKYLSKTKGIRWLEPDHFFREIKADPLDQQVLSSAQSFSREQIFSLTLSITAAFILFLTGYALWNWASENNNIIRLIKLVPYSYIIIILPLLGFLLYWCRQRYRLVYGTLEFLVGTLTSFYVFYPTFDYASLSIIQSMQILGGLYIMVRGLDNFGKGLNGTKYEEFWTNIFPS